MSSPHAWKIEIQLQISDFFGFIDKNGKHILSLWTNAKTNNVNEMCN